MYRWFMAYKYVFSRITTFAALVVVALSVALLIVVISVMEGFRSELQSRIRGTSSDLKVESTRYIDLKDPERVAKVIEGVPGVRATAPYVETLTFYRVETGFRVGGEFEDRYLRVVDVERELRVGDLARYIQAVGFSRLPSDAGALFSRDWNERGLWNVLGRRPPHAPGEFPLAGGQPGHLRPEAQQVW